MSPISLALLSAALWGATDLVTTYVGRQIGSLRVVVIAVSTSLVLAGGVAIARGALTQEYDPVIVGATLLMGVGAGVSYIAVFTAFRLGPLSVVSPTISAYGAGITLLGLRTTGSGRERRASLASPGVAFALIGLLFFAVITVLLTIPIKEYGWSTAITLSRIGNFATVWVILAVVRSKRKALPRWVRTDLLGEGHALTRRGLLLAGIVGIGDTIAFFVFAAALEEGPTWAVSLLSSLGPIIVVFGGYIGYQERLRRPQILGIALILLGIVLATLPA